MDRYEGEYNGAALQSFLLALGDSKPLIDRVLRNAGVDRIDADRWYEMNWAASVYKAISDELGRPVIVAVGRRMIDAAPFPPGINDVRDVLQSLDAAYRLSVRGPRTGAITCTFDDDDTATLHWATPGICAMNIGIIEGCCAKFGARALVEHGATGCAERGASACIYRVTF
ncbi:MAG: hypothetical protein IPM54_04545 [Polyangiaceae bacterium]|nr:hypothetical protein [Polyangiaceae bacterium]